MKTELENQDIEAIAQRVLELMKPLIATSSKKADDIIFDVQGLCEYLKVSTKWIYERTQLKEMPYLKVKGLLRFRKVDIDKWLNDRHTPAASTPERVLKAIK